MDDFLILNKILRVLPGFKRKCYSANRRQESGRIPWT